MVATNPRYILPFRREYLSNLYNGIGLPHPSTIGFLHVKHLDGVVNDLSIPGHSFMFMLSSTMPIVAPREGEIVMAERRNGIVHSENAHETDYVVIQHKDGTAIRIEHLTPAVNLREHVSLGQILGMADEYTLNGRHIHLYSFSTPEQDLPNHPIMFTGFKPKRRNLEYDLIEFTLETLLPGLSLKDKVERIKSDEKLLLRSSAIVSSAYGVLRKNCTDEELVIAVDDAFNQIPYGQAVILSDGRINTMGRL